MNKIFNYFMVIALVSVLLEGCSNKSALVDGHKVATEKKVLFSTALGPNTKTWYSGKIEGGVERIDWQIDDRIQIASDECQGTQNSVYQIIKVKTTGQKSYATIDNYPNTINGLQWGEGMHHFYALYPSGESSADATKVKLETTKSGTANTGCVVSAFLPEQQILTPVNDTLRPNMKYAYMFASKATTKVSSVELSFKPIVTAFRFAVSTTEKVTLNSFTLSSETCALVGDFKGTVANDNISKMVFEVPQKSETNNSVTINLGGVVLNPAPAENSELVFTLFTLPASRVAGKEDKLTELTLTFDLYDKDGGRLLKILTLKRAGESGNLEFSGGKKYNISGLKLPAPNLYPINISEIVVGELDSTNSDASFGDIIVEDLDKE